MFSVKPPLTILLSFALLLGNAPAVLAANSFTYLVPTAEHAGKFSGEIPIDRIGNMLVPRGLASFSDDELQIRAVPQWMFDRSLVLKGVIIRAEAVQQKGGLVLAGLVLMLDGLWIGNLGESTAVESIDTMDGAAWHGRILSRNGDALSFQHRDGKTENISFSKIKTIDSPRAFTFNIDADSVKIDPVDSSMSFAAKQLSMKTQKTGRHMFWDYDRVPKSNLKGTEAGISKTALATFIGLDIISTIAPPIAIPLVLNAKNQRAAKNTIARTEFQTFASSLQPSSTASTAASGAGGM